MSKLGATEAQIERAIRDYLELKGWVVYKTDAGEAARAARRRGMRGALAPGAPDLIALKEGRGSPSRSSARAGSSAPRRCSSTSAWRPPVCR